MLRSREANSRRCSEAWRANLRITRERRRTPNGVRPHYLTSIAEQLGFPQSFVLVLVLEDPKSSPTPDFEDEDEHEDESARELKLLGDCQFSRSDTEL